jgi:hypothetical protein
MAHAGLEHLYGLIVDGTGYGNSCYMHAHLYHNNNITIIATSISYHDESSNSRL